VTWSNGTPTIICEECGHEAMPEEFVWFQGELAICKNAVECAKRKDAQLYRCEKCGKIQAKEHLTFVSNQPTLECRDFKACRERQEKGNYMSENKKGAVKTALTDVKDKPSEFLEKIRMFKYEGRSERNIAEELGVSVSMLRSAVAIAKNEVRRAALDNGTTPTFPVHVTNPNRHMDKARELVLNHYNRLYMPEGEALHISEVYVVHFDKTLQNWKALVATEAIDGMYFEVAYNGDKNETYLDAYKRVSNEVITETVSHSRYSRQPTEAPHQPGAVDGNGDPLPNSRVHDQKSD